MVSLQGQPSTRRVTHQDEAENAADAPSGTNERPPDADIRRPPQRDGRLIEVDGVRFAVDAALERAERDRERDGEPGGEQD